MLEVHSCVWILAFRLAMAWILAVMEYWRDGASWADSLRVTAMSVAG
jgi:hypothetical protein